MGSPGISREVRCPIAKGRSGSEQALTSWKIQLAAWEHLRRNALADLDLVGERTISLRS